MAFKNKIVVITGGAKGIGKATTEAFYRNSAITIIIDKDKKAGKSLKLKLEKKSGKCEFYVADVSKENEVSIVVDSLIKKWGRIDILVNNAGVGHDGTVTEDSPIEWDHVINTNLRSVYVCCHFMIPEITKTKGVIINVGSAQSKTATKRSAAYVASKHGVLGLTKAMAVDHAPTIRVVAVLPGSVDTALFRAGTEDPMHLPEYKNKQAQKCPLKRIGNPNEIAEVILFLASEKASFITGNSITVDGGLLSII